jgi:beta-lactam-binding protein with PASTA domain
MIRLFQFVTLLLGLAIVALGAAIITMRFAIHGAEITVPSFKGLTSQQALNKAAALGVEMTIDNRLYSAEVPAGRILTQSPPAGTVVRSEWHVRATESLGPQLVAIPNLVGQPERSATIEVRRLGLELGGIAHMPFAAPAETVIAQNPQAGAAGVERPSVAIIVSDAAPEAVPAFVMPTVTGQQYVTVAATLSRAALKLASAIPAPDTDATATHSIPGTIVAQSPLPGYRVDADIPIELTVTR